jgi:hypothetical protein
MKLLATITVALLLGAHAQGCSKHQVAEVKKHEGDVKRDTSSAQQKWQAAPDGTELGMGDGLKTGPSANAVLHLTNGGNIAVSSDTTIRFLASKPGARQPKLAIETGEASIEAADAALTVETMIGVAQIEPGGKLLISADGTSTRIEVTVGAARIETEDGGVALSPGKSFDVSLGGAIVEREAVDASTDSGRAERADAAAVTAVADAGVAGATTIEVRGAGVRVQAKGETAFKPLPEGASSASAGDVLEVPNGASVDVRRGARHGRLVGFGRFVIGDAEGSSLVRASSGRVELEATSEDVVVEVPGGTIVARSGEGKSRVDADVGVAGTKLGVGQGQAEVRGKGTSETIRAGEHATLTTKGVVVVANRGPERPDFTVRAGDSVVVRDPRPPTALGFDFSAVCPGSAVVSRADGAATVRGEHKAAMSLAAGRHEYAIRCIGPDGVEEKAAASGTVTIVPDAARAELASLPPSTVVDMDGRRYTVLYQNLLPSVIARWIDAPKAGSYALFVDKARTKSTTPKQSLKPGSIGEGTHTLHFETEDGSQKSAETTLVIKFDNAAPAASVRDPVDGSFHPGDSVKVSGVVVEGWTVSVNGAAVPLDEQKRFSTTATVPPGENALVLRLSHPKRGTVYYVRHASGAAGGAH